MMQISFEPPLKLESGDSRAKSAIQFALSSHVDDPIQTSQMIDAFQKGEEPRPLLYAAFAGDLLGAAALMAPAAGKSALVFVGFDPQIEPPARWADHAVARLVRFVLDQCPPEIRLIQSLLRVDQAELAHCLAAGGMRRITRLLYLQRSVSNPPHESTAQALSWVSYRDEVHGVFRQALAESYVATLDCPELHGVRTIEEAMQSHRAAGIFDPSLWWVVRRNDQIAGVVLLAWYPSNRLCEIVYVGVAQDQRRKGVADALMQRGLALAHKKCAKNMALAVDERNKPARAMYAKWGFETVMDRDAWIATPSLTRRC